jgi:nucleoside 2-deoxyribosyltransferase
MLSARRPWTGDPVGSDFGQAWLGMPEAKKVIQLPASLPARTDHYCRVSRINPSGSSDRKFNTAAAMVAKPHLVLVFSNYAPREMFANRGEKMKIYLAGPLFTLSDIEFNKRLKGALESAGHHVWLPQERTAHLTEAGDILAMLLEGIGESDVLVGNMDGADPDSGTSWECGFAYAKRKPTILFRTDTRSRREINLGPYNLMMWASATVRLDGPFSSIEDLVKALLDNLGEQLKH